jgi:DNA-directed RNA polymerase specialized sigma24 family protein
MINKWITDNYSDIETWAKGIVQQHGDWEDLMHYSLLTLLEHPKADELAERGHLRWFLVRIMLNSSRGKKSDYYRTYRQESYRLTDAHTDIQDEAYDTDIDTVTEWIHGILEDMKHGDVDDWYRAQIFELCAEQDRINFSKLSRELQIPRTSISNAYYEAIEIIKQRLLTYANDYPHVGNSIRSYLSTID